MSLVALFFIGMACGALLLGCWGLACKLWFLRHADDYPVVFKRGPSWPPWYVLWWEDFWT